MLKAHFILGLLAIAVCLTSVKAEDSMSDELKSAVIDYQKVQTEVNAIINQKNSHCQLVPYKDSAHINRCELMNYCEIYKSNANSPMIYQGSDGVIENDRFYREENILLNCMKSQYQGDIEDAVDAFAKQNEADHLKMVLALNKKLQNQIKKNGESLNFQKLNNELVNRKLQNQIKDLNGDNDSTVAWDLKSELQKIKKDLRLKISNNTIDQIVELSNATEDQSYQIESKKFEASLFKSYPHASLFSDLRNFTSTKMAGGSEKLVANQKLYNQKAQDVYNVFDDVKKDLVTYLKSKENYFNKNEMERALKRVELIKFKLPVLAPDFMAACKNPNAWYSSEINSITVCPGWFDRPKSFLYETFAHELSHSIDPCNLPAPFKVKSTSADIVEDGPFPINISMQELKLSQTLIGEIDDSKMKETDQKDMKVKAHPFKEVLSCLMSSKSIDAKVLDKKDVKKKIEEYLKMLETNHRNNDTDPEYKFLKFASTHFDQYMDQYKYCHIPEIGGTSQLEEAFADKLAADLVGNKIAKMSREDAVSFVDKVVLGDLNTDDALCAEDFALKTIHDKNKELNCTTFFEEQKNNEKMGTALKIVGKINIDSHPPLIKRYDKLIFANPIIREKLGCGKNGVKYCEN